MNYSELVQQLHLDALLRAALQADERVQFALVYGSFTQGSGDRFSDVEYYAFVEKQQEFEILAWLEHALNFSSFQILHHVVNEFGTPNVTVSGLIRIELHVQPVERMPDILHWPGEHIHPERMLVKDQDGKLRALLQELASKPEADPSAEAQLILDRAVNWLVFGLNVLRRGEGVRALELLRWIQVALLRLARIEQGQTAHWLNPYRLAEKELPVIIMDRYATLTGGLQELEPCYWAAWGWLRELVDTLNLHLSPELRSDLTVTLAE